MRTAFWDPSAGGGLFNVWSFRHTGALVASGLGGGSLIYANVFLRKDPDSFLAAHTWPITARDLEPHYERVEKPLTPVPTWTALATRLHARRERNAGMKTIHAVRSRFGVAGASRSEPLDQISATYPLNGPPGHANDVQIGNERAR